MTLYLHGVGHFHPENEISNQFLEDLDIGTNDQWILDRVGIRSRRTVLPLEYIHKTKNAEPRDAMEAALYANADLGRSAVELAISRAGIEKSDVGMLIAGSSAMDTATPAEACNIARRAGTRGAGLRCEFGVHQFLRAALPAFDDATGPAARLRRSRRRRLPHEGRRLFGSRGCRVVGRWRSSSRGFDAAFGSGSDRRKHRGVESGGKRQDRHPTARFLSTGGANGPDLRYQADGAYARQLAGAIRGSRPEIQLRGSIRQIAACSSPFARAATSPPSVTSATSSGLEIPPAPALRRSSPWNGKNGAMAMTWVWSEWALGSRGRAT